MTSGTGSRSRESFLTKRLRILGLRAFLLWKTVLISPYSGVFCDLVKSATLDDLQDGVKGAVRRFVSI